MPVMFFFKRTIIQYTVKGRHLILRSIGDANLCELEKFHEARNPQRESLAESASSPNRGGRLQGVKEVFWKSNPKHDVQDWYNPKSKKSTPSRVTLKGDNEGEAVAIEEKK